MMLQLGRPESFTPEALTELVGHIHPGTVVTNVTVKAVRGYGTQNVSMSGRVLMDLEYAPGCSDRLPRSVVAKMSLDDDIWCAKCYSFFENEVNFYTRIRPHLELEAPFCLAGEFDQSTRRYVLLLEDLSARQAHMPSMSEELTKAQVEGVLDTHARLHATFWHSPRFSTDLAWVPTHMNGGVEELMHTVVREAIQSTIGKFKFKREILARLGTDEAALYAAMCAVKRHQASMPPTLLHGDSHLGNTYRLPSGVGGLLDWQVMIKGHVMHDVSYLITTALSIGQRRSLERELIAFYRDRLQIHGVREAPSMDALWMGHRLACLWNFYYGWLPCPAENYGWELLTIALLRTSAAVEDHETLELAHRLR